jgi:hypothetical protein
MAVAGTLNGSNLVLVDTGSTVVDEIAYPAALVVSRLITDTATGYKRLVLIYAGQQIFVLPSYIFDPSYGNTLFGSSDPVIAKGQAQTQLGSAASGSPGMQPKIGDIKESYYSLAHDGWVPMVGQAKNTLLTTQQSAATALGIGANLPNGADTVIVGASATKLAGSNGGAASVAIGQSNLPAVNLIGGSHGHSASDSGHTHPTWSGSGGQQLTDANGTGTAGGFGIGSLTSNSQPKMATGSGTANISVAASGNLSIPLGGSATPLPVQNPYLALYRFIYLGA